MWVRFLKLFHGCYRSMNCSILPNKESFFCFLLLFSIEFITVYHSSTVLHRGLSHHVSENLKLGFLNKMQNMYVHILNHLNLVCLERIIEVKALKTHLDILSSFLLTLNWKKKTFFVYSHRSNRMFCNGKFSKTLLRAVLQNRTRQLNIIKKKNRVANYLKTAKRFLTNLPVFARLHIYGIDGMCKIVPTLISSSQSLWLGHTHKDDRYYFWNDSKPSSNWKLSRYKIPSLQGSHGNLLHYYLLCVKGGLEIPFRTETHMPLLMKITELIRIYESHVDIPLSARRSKYRWFFWIRGSTS